MYEEFSVERYYVEYYVGFFQRLKIRYDMKIMKMYEEGME